MKQLLTGLITLLLCAGGVHAQSPGGIGSPELWFQTGPVGTALNGSYHWIDYSGDSLRLNVYNTGGASAGEEYTTSTFRSYNGHPAISLDKLLDTKTREVMLKRTNLSQATVFGVFAPNVNFNSEMLLYGLNGRSGSGVWVSTDKLYPSRESGKGIFDYGQTEGMDLMYSTNDAESDVNKFREKSMRIAAYYRSIPPSTGIWGERNKAVFSFGYYKAGNTNNTSTFSIPTSANRQFTGYIPEFIAYNRLLTPLERRQVDSYLAIKYGLSLPVSYIGSSGQLLWDYAEDTGYNNRITAIYRDDASGLKQYESSTSYEEGPNYADLAAYDYYHLGNPNNRSSSSRLLVIGRQFANDMDNGSYAFWGDNNASINLKEIEGVLGTKMMERRWLLKTNIANAPGSERALAWQVQDLAFNTSGFVTELTKTIGSNAPETGYAYTGTPLREENGYIGINYTTIFGGIYLKFGGQGFAAAGGYDYGYYIAPDYKVYPIVKGAVSGTSFTTLVLTTRLEVEKKGNEVYLRVDGSRLDNSRIIIEPQDAGKPWYASLAFTKGTLQTTVGLRHGGFTDTGNRVELSFASNRASDFKNANGKSYLVIDRSGTGNFNSADVEYIPADEINTLRQKAIFNNVFFDTDGNGSDVFTFAYNESEIFGEIEIIDPECAQANGEVTITLSSGKPAFIYTLTNTATGEVVKTGRENSYILKMTGLAGGDYKLKVEEAGGFNIENGNSSGTATRAKTTNFLPVFEGALEWMVTGTSDSYMVGYTTIAEDINSSKNIIHYGLKKQGNSLYKVVSGKLTSLGISVAVGDVLKVSKTMSKVTYYKNGTEIGSTSISILDYLVKFYGLIDMSEGPAKILNVNATGFFNLADYNWTTMDGISILHSDNASLTYNFSLTDPCQGQGTQQGTQAVAQKADLLKLSYEQGTMTVKAQIEFKEPDVVSFVAYNLSGQLVKKVNLTTPQKIQVADIGLPTTGVYIIKAITVNNGEYSKKFLVQ